MSLALIGILLTATQDPELTPARAMELLRETHRLMRLAEERLNEAMPAQAEPHEKGATDRLAELIRKSRGSGGSPTLRPGSQREARPGESGDRARRSAVPKPGERPSAFKSKGESGSWGRLPPAVRKILLESSREELPVEFQELWRRYRESLESSAK